MKFPSRAIVESTATTMMGTRDDWRIRVPARPRPVPVGASWLGPLVLLATSLIGWIPLSGAVGKEGDVAFALFIGSVSIMFMAWSNVLSIRASWLEPLFGGLDTMYRWHRWIGGLSVGAMWLHMEMVDDVRGIPGASRDVADAAEDLAGTAANMLYALVFVSLLRWIPTRWWRISHKFLVVPYTIACWHFFTATKPYANDSAWGIWFAAAMLVGLGAWFVRVVWRDMLRRGAVHRVVSVESTSGTVTVDLEPVGRPITHDQGQFVFLKWHRNGASEPHPFTIASAPSDPVLRFVIRDLGDWTSRFVTTVAPGDLVTVEGPYGRMQAVPDRHRDTVVWVAGGVGITPFLGAACSRDPGDGPRPILFFCIRSRHDAPGMAELTRAHDEGRIDLRVHASSENTRLRPSDLEREFGPGGLLNAHVAMCGPDALLRQMIPAVRSLGATHVHVEAFDIRTGVGPDLSRWIDGLIAARRARGHRSVSAGSEPDRRRVATSSAGTRDGSPR